MNHIVGTDRIEILALLAEGHQPAAIALAYPYHANVIARFAFKQRLPNAKGHKVGAELAQVIRQRLAAGETHAALSVEYGLHRNTIGRILAGTHWKV